MINNKSLNIYVAGHKGMVGSALIRLLKNQNVELIIKDRSELDLLNQKQVQNFFKSNKIDQVYMSAAKVGGIHANNTYPADFIYENIMIQANIIHNAFLSSVKKILFLGSSCIYPKNINHPMKEEELLTGKLELTNEPYAIAKIAGIKMCESYNRQYSFDYRSVMPTNLYGPWDNFHPENSHVVPGLIRRFHEAKIQNKKNVVIWGTGKPMREFLHVDDMASASLYVLGLKDNIYKSNTKPMLSHINVGSSEEISIADLAKMISKIIEYQGDIKFDTSKKDGPPRKLMNSQRIEDMGWKPSIKLEEGIAETYKWYLQNINNYNK